MIKGYRRADTMQANGTHLQGYIIAKYSELVEIFGEPESSDGYKVSGEWIVIDNNDRVFTVYDWKCTSLYGSDLPSVDSFRKSSELQEFNIGGHADATDFIHAVNKELTRIRECKGIDQHQRG